ncbi:hypothetical protein EPA93_43140 [Ktedonosporobacter rubrisoli]|uniref:Uncharacterized protein n=1 Tax=Ktedonosporobacter rubrisoli TaxID=2509675 RepID=A0A4P6K385_KTERU|nr:hypothetical protein [Ktedonosporobacter rubrisoli]QBD82412.1 hypothetical protein EPA93_43140 [Ktedonosporobacter rubrisoli]
MAKRVPQISFSLCCIILLSFLLNGCNNSPAVQEQAHTRTFQAPNTRAITYSTQPDDVLIRTFHSGGLYGTLELHPEFSIYGDGTYILGLERKGKLSTDELQQLLNILISTDGVLDFTHQQFSDLQDQNATFLELNLNGSHKELVYGIVNHYHASQQELDEYQRLDRALTAIAAALKGPVQPYQGNDVALLVRRTFSPDLTQTIPDWSLPDFTLAQAAAYECGLLPPDEVSFNGESPCLKYTLPEHAILLNASQLNSLKAQMHGEQGTFSEGGHYYTVILRPLLPDEASRKIVAMFGSAQDSYKDTPLLAGPVPPEPTPTPQK